MRIMQNIELHPLLVNDADGNPLYIYQGDGFRYGTDAVLLSDFARVRPRDRALDLCAGNGIVALLLYARQPSAAYTCVERNPDAAELARRSMAYNRADVRVVTADVNAFNEREAYDHITCNPPYMRVGAGARNVDDAVYAARHEVSLDMNGVASCAARCLRYGGRLSLIHRTERMTDVFCALRAHGVEPKRLRIVPPCGSATAHLFLIEAVKGAKSGLALV